MYAGESRLRLVFNSDWLKKRREFFKPITKRIDATSNQTRTTLTVTFDTQVKLAHCSLEKCIIKSPSFNHQRNVLCISHDNKYCRTKASLGFNLKVSFNTKCAYFGGCSVVTQKLSYMQFVIVLDEHIISGKKLRAKEENAPFG